jgi:hypothetical protein
MADIDVVPKRGGKSWLMWLLLAIAAIAIVWMMMSRGDDGVDQVSHRLVDRTAATGSLGAADAPLG